MKEKIAIIGCGAWGLTIAKICAENQAQVMVWCHNEESANQINNQHQISWLPNIQLPMQLVATTNLKQVIEESDNLIIAVASNYMDIIEQVKKYYKPNTPILTLTKGLLEGKNTIFVTEYIRQIFSDNVPIVLLSGPNIAIEIAQKLPAAAVIAAKDDKIAQRFQNLLSNSYFRAYRSHDMKGVSLGGILKNIIAIAAGAIDGLQLGTNAKSALVTRGLQEMIRFGTVFGAKPETFFGLSGLGDLITTCTSPNSRNWQTGYQLAKTNVLPDFTNKTVQIAEGVKSTKIVYAVAKDHQVEMPITNEIYAVLYEQKPITKAVQTLMTRTLKAEE